MPTFDPRSDVSLTPGSEFFLATELKVRTLSTTTKLTLGTELMVAGGLAGLSCQNGYHLQCRRVLGEGRQDSFDAADPQAREREFGYGTVPQLILGTRGDHRPKHDFLLKSIGENSAKSRRTICSRPKNLPAKKFSAHGCPRGRAPRARLDFSGPPAMVAARHMSARRWNRVATGDHRSEQRPATADFAVPGYGRFCNRRQ